MDPVETEIGPVPIAEMASEGRAAAGRLTGDTLRLDGTDMPSSDRKSAMVGIAPGKSSISKPSRELLGRLAAANSVSGEG